MGSYLLNYNCDSGSGWGGGDPFLVLCFFVFGDSDSFSKCLESVADVCGKSGSLKTVAVGCLLSDSIP